MHSLNLSLKDHRCKSCRCVCLGEVTNEVGTHIQLGSLQVLSFFGASRSLVVGCVCKRGHFVRLIADHIPYLEYFPI